MCSNAAPRRETPQAADLPAFRRPRAARASRLLHLHREIFREMEAYPMKGRLVLAAAAVGSLAVAGCSSSSSSSTAAAAEPRVHPPPPRRASRRSASRARSPARWPRWAPSSCTSRSSRWRWTTRPTTRKITLVQGDTQLQPAQATTVTQQFISNSKIVAVVGPAGSQEVEASAALMARAGMAFISGSATAAALTTGKYPTFFRVVSKDSVQGPQDANYIVNTLHPKSLMIVDDQEAYSTGLVSRDDAGLRGGRDQGRPRVGLAEGHRLLLAGGQGHARHLGGGPALAGRGQRPAVRPGPGPAAQERP